MSNLEDYAKFELLNAGLFNKDSEYGGLMGEAVMKMIKLFADEGHSGFSANMAINIFSKLARFEPLTPLTGEDWEWNEVSAGTFQNKRCSHVFKGKDGKAYDIEGRIFRYPDGGCFTSGDSRVYVTFPYSPTKEYIDVPEEK